MQKQTDYIGNYIYEDNKLSFILTGKGRILPDSSGFAYEYFIKDHLGNTRLVVKDTAVISENHYYPFGLQISGLSLNKTQPKNKYLYNGKELQDNFGLGWYDYGKRFYDAEVPRFTSIDPLAEKYSFQSPYVYAANNPIKFVDRNGEYAWKPNGDGTWTAEKGDGAWTLAEDAGITYEEAKDILANTYKENSEGHNMGTYIDPNDGVEKSKVDPGDVVDVNSKEFKERTNNTTKLTALNKKIKSIQKQIKLIDKSVDSINSEIKASQDAQKSSATDGGSGTKGISLYFGLQANKQKKEKNRFENKKKSLEKEYRKNKATADSLIRKIKN